MAVMSKGEQRVPVRVDSALGRTLGQGSEPQGVRAPKTQRTRSGWMRDVLDRRPLEVDPDPGVDPRALTLHANSLLSESSRKATCMQNCKCLRLGHVCFIQYLFLK